MTMMTEKEEVKKEQLDAILEGIKPLDQETMSRTRERINSLIKPPGSLGRLEDLAVQLSGITGEAFPKLEEKRIIVMAADHGVHCEGVAPNPQEITAIQTPNFAKGVTGVCALAKQSKGTVSVVDIGVNGDTVYPGVLQRKIRMGTSNMAKGPAMSYEEAIRSIEIGIAVAEEAIENGATVLGIGEMGISNTTASTAVISVLGGLPATELVGVGAGLPENRLPHKAQVIQKSIDLNQPDPSDPIDVLAKVGGFEIGGMTGVIIGAAKNRVPLVIDGFISYASTLLALHLSPAIKDYLIPSHQSAERGSQKALSLIGLSPMFDLGFRLGEGSGAAIAFNFIDAALSMNREMITFEEAKITL